MTEPVWISEQQVVSMMNLSGAITALEAGLAQQAAGAARNMSKAHVTWDHSNLHAIGAAYPQAGVIGTKTWAHTDGGACPLLILFDSENGQLRAIIEAFALGQMRTGGISGVATRWLAQPDAEVLALIGTGKQAMAQLAAVAVVRPLKLVRVFSTTPEKRRAFVERARGRWDMEIVESSSVEEAVADAPIVTTVTRATEPFLSVSALARGAHINAVGAITSERVELADDVFLRCTKAVVDDPGAAKRLSTEYTRAFGDGNRWESVLPLCEVVANRIGRSRGDDLTVFKAMGMGISDLALGLRLLELAREHKVGTPLPQPRRETPRLD
ncbi:ornithine cyclodeaminase family protein [Burkholderia cenocepacia]|uniref:ornithine cyclodeaminase family protein n=1 Tax=Burkholderia cenocepacia TaxID=95486 RepID=UPI000F571970|nr:ornithine cyclodeaminase family protein [Burkholderia cenocepacia]RQU32799.1 ornithine cyclodeaminase family protein [Burkholderia cenocepacia]RQU57012.1 ornithine cyclodeaminase family protein [Burkholderia cenocepacia]